MNTIKPHPTAKACLRDRFFLSSNVIFNPSPGQNLIAEKPDMLSRCKNIT